MASVRGGAFLHENKGGDDPGGLEQNFPAQCELWSDSQVCSSKDGTSSGPPYHCAQTVKVQMR